MRNGTASQIKFLRALALAAPLSACVAVVAVPVGPAVTAARSWPGAASCPQPARSADSEARVLALLNAHRAQAGLAPLRASAPMAAAAHAFACELRGGQGLSHTGTDGSTLRERLARSGIAASLIAENLASGQRGPAEVVAAWMASPGHRANILRPGLSSMGLGLADGAQPIWVLDLSS